MSAPEPRRAVPMNDDFRPPCYCDRCTTERRGRRRETGCSDCAVWRDRLARVKQALDAALAGEPNEAQATGVMYGLAASIGVWLAEGTNEAKEPRDG